MPTTVKEPSTIVQALRQNHIQALRRLRVEETEAGVVLHGQLPTYYLKQLAQEAVLPLLEGRRLLNRVIVVRGTHPEF